jgi:hypothetical protein|tara:strand:- start:148 stop:252 length:105 start_codon:yes stop_codon:yes gene_type:complete
MQFDEFLAFSRDISQLGTGGMQILVGLKKNLMMT